jgi:taurine transport system substrate-binding protein
VVNKDFAAKNKPQVVAFAKVMDAANKAYLANPAAWTPENPSVKEIAKVTGAGADQIPEILEGYTFVPLSEQLGADWLGNAAKVMKSTAEFLKSAKRIDTVAADYAPFVDTTIAAEAAK